MAGWLGKGAEGVDGTARLQYVSSETAPLYSRLIQLSGEATRVLLVFVQSSAIAPFIYTLF
jgi:predicted NodU family carbamoyl transferase